jgi:predicted secreted protein
MVDILPAPAASTRRVVKSINVFNNDTVTHTVTIYLNDNSTSYAIKKITLATGASWASDDVSVDVAIPEGDKGDITVSSGGSVWTINAGAVGTSKLGVDITPAGKALLDDADASAQQTTLGLGSIATQSSSSISITGGSITGITDLAVADGGTGASTASDARTNLGLGTIATQSSSNVSITGGSIAGITDLTVADGGTGSSTASGARTNLGLGTIATQDASNVTITGGSITGITDLKVADGGTGASTAADARANLSAAASGANTDITSVYLNQSGLKIKDSNGSHGLIISPISDLLADRTLSIITGDSDRTLTISGNATVSGVNTGDQSVFTTIAVEGQSNIVADTTSDTLTIAAGSNITITTNATSDTLTIASTAAGVTNGDKGDIVVSGSGDVWTIDSGVVSNAKLATMNLGEIKARVSGSGGSPEDATITQVLDLTGGWAQGSVLYRGPSSWAALSPGVSGQVLQTQGAGANPIWGTRGGQNRLINGDFSVSQRTKPGSTVEYTNITAFRNLGGACTHDRWFVMSSSATSNTLSTNIRVAQGTPNIAGSTNAPSGTSCILQGTGAVVSKFGIAQILESTLMPQLAGKTVTLSFQAKASEATPTQVKNICAAVINVSAPTYPSRLFVTTWGAVDVNPTVYASGHTALATSRALLSGTWTNYSVTATVGATEPANLIAFIWVETVTGSTVNESVYIQDVQLETGAVPTAFERLSYDENLLRCQRYFYAKYGIAGQNTVYGSGNWNTVSTANPFEASVPLPVQMRVSPTVRFAPRVLKAGTTNATTTTTGFNSTATTISVPSTTNTNAFPDVFPGYIQVGSEVMSYTGKTTLSFTGVTRGVDSTYPASAANGAQVTEVATPLISSQFTIFPNVNPNLTNVTYVRLLNIGASPSLPASREIKVLVSRNAKVNFPGPAPAPGLSGSGELRDAGNGLSFIAADAEI